MHFQKSDCWLFHISYNNLHRTANCLFPQNVIGDMNSPSTCIACHSDNSVVFPAGSYGSVLGNGREIRINELEAAAASGCQPCTLLSNLLRVFRRLSPSFETNYPRRDPDKLFVQRSNMGSLLVALVRRSHVDHLELYTQIGMCWLSRETSIDWRFPHRFTTIVCCWMGAWGSWEFDFGISDEENQTLDFWVRVAYLLCECTESMPGDADTSLASKKGQNLAPRNCCKDGNLWNIEPLLGCVSSSHDNSRESRTTTRGDWMGLHT